MYISRFLGYIIQEFLYYIGYNYFKISTIISTKLFMMIYI